ncbi:MAG: response regulator [Burkholderiales bacterium]
MYTPDHVIQHLAELADFVSGRAPALLDANLTDFDQHSQVSMLEEYVRRISALSALATAAGAREVLLACPFAERNLAAFLAYKAPLTASEWALLAEWPMRVLDYSLLPDESAASLGLIDHLSDPNWPRTVELAESSSIHPSPAAHEASAPTAINLSGLDERRATEITEPPRNDLDFSSADHSQDHGLHPESNVADSALRSTEFLQRLRSAVATLAGVARTRGLDGLCGVAERVHTTLALLRISTEPRLIEVKSLCTQLSTAARRYLAAPGDELVSHSLIDVLLAPVWSQRLTDAERDQLLHQLRAPSLVMSTAEGAPPVFERTAHPTETAAISDEDAAADVDSRDEDGATSIPCTDDSTVAALAPGVPSAAEDAFIADIDNPMERVSRADEGTLSDGSDTFDRANAEAALASIEEVAIERGLLGLEEAGLRARQGLNALCDNQRSSSENIRDLIDRFVVVAWAYANAPSAPESTDALVALLAESGWPEPLSDDDAPLLSSVLRDGGAIEGALSADEPEAVDISQLEPVLAPVDSSPPNLAAQTAERADGFSADDAPAVDASTDELDQTRAHLGSRDEHDDSSIESAPGDTVGAAPAGVSAELFEMLREESAKLKPGLDELLHQGSSTEQDAASRRAAAQSYAEEIRRLAEACTSIGVGPLGALLDDVQRSVERDCAEGFSAAQRDALSALFGLLGAYLATPNDPSLGEGLIDILRRDIWSSPIAADKGFNLARGLSEVTLVSNSADTPARQKEATANDVSLAVPDDINRELFESLLQELPIQTAEFSASVQRLAGREGKDADVDSARRAAHTLKGAANTVGIRGIANLTHHVEDILTALFKHRAKPGPALAAVLVDAADCLEAMCELVTGSGPEPDQSMAVMQAVLDWANRIDHDGIEATGSTSESESAEEEPGQSDVRTSQAESANEPNAQTTTAVARVSVTLIDELLRLTGETIISTGQVSDRLLRVIDQVRTIQAQNQTFMSLAAEMEYLVDVRGVASPHQQRAGLVEFDALEFEHYSEIHTVSRRLTEAATDSKAFSSQVQTDLTALNELVDGQSRLHLQSQETVMRTRMVPASTILSRLQRSARQSSRQLDKRVILNVSGAETPIDSQILAALVDPLMHMLRNAIDHGIEDETARRRAGKPSEGRIDLAFAREGNHMLVRMQDDGAGLDLAAIRRTAESKGLIRADQTLSEDELRRLILAPGFSTRSEATQLSGRGVGMDIVHSSVLQLKGSINLRSTQGKGLLIELRLPAALISTHALQIGIEGRTLTVSTRGIDNIVYASADQMQSVGGIPSMRLADEVLSVVDLESLLELPVAPEGDLRGAFPVLLVRQDSGVRKAIRVREVISSRDIVVKPLSVYLPKIQGIIGLTVLGDGNVQPVIDLLDLLRVPMLDDGRRPDHRIARRRDEGIDDRAPGAHSVLVVDDSISARRATAQCMKDAGFVPRTAIDGQDALAVLEKWTPDIVLVDMEMPRMNGLELAVALRARPSTKNTPMIMITSRSTEKHRRQAQAAGIDLYLTKPFNEDELVKRALELINTRAHA